MRSLEPGCSNESLNGKWPSLWRSVLPPCPRARQRWQISPGTANGFSLRLQALQPVARSIFGPEVVERLTSTQLARLLENVDVALDRIEAEVETHAPVGKMELGNLPPESARYFACREQLKKVERLAQAVERKRLGSRKSSTAATPPKAKAAKLVVRQFISGNPRLGRLRDTVAMRLELAEWDASESAEVTDSPVLALCRDLVLLDAMVRQPWDDQ